MTHWIQFNQSIINHQPWTINHQSINHQSNHRWFDDLPAPQCRCCSLDLMSSSIAVFAASMFDSIRFGLLFDNNECNRWQHNTIQPRKILLLNKNKVNRNVTELIRARDDETIWRKPKTYASVVRWIVSLYRWRLQRVVVDYKRSATTTQQTDRQQQQEQQNNNNKTRTLTRCRRRPGIRLEECGKPGTKPTIERSKKNRPRVVDDGATQRADDAHYTDCKPRRHVMLLIRWTDTCVVTWAVC